VQMTENERLMINMDNRIRYAMAPIYEMVGFKVSEGFIDRIGGLRLNRSLLTNLKFLETPLFVFETYEETGLGKRK
jgi:hypothetical protein